MIPLLVMTSFLTWAQFAESALCPAGCNCANRKVMECTGIGLRSLPRRISPIVCEFVAGNNSITELSTRMLGNAKTLQKLILSRNNVASLRPNNFRNIKSLTHLDLSFNTVQGIQAYTFVELSKLRVLNLESNNITSISMRAFSHIDSLRVLILSDNNLRAIPSKLLENQITLEILKLDGNRISTLPNDVFKKQSALRVLDLSRNRIQRISVEVFQRLYLLQELRLHHNQIKEIDRSLSDKLRRRCRNKNNSSMTTTGNVTSRKVFSKMTLLRILDINNNNLNIVSYESFQELDRLESLVLQANPWRCTCALRLAVETFPPTMRHGVWDEAVCRDPLDRNGIKIGELFLNVGRQNNATPASLHVTDTTIALKDLSNTTRSDVTPTTSATSKVGKGGRNTYETRRTTRGDSTATVERVLKFETVPAVEESGTDGRDLKDTTGGNKHSKRDRWWLVASISGGIFVIFCAILFAINKCGNKRQRRKRYPRKRSRGDNMSFRTSSSNSRFFDYQFSGRPLPQAPNASGRSIGRNTPDEVRASKRGRCGSNTSGFISMRTCSNGSNHRGSYYSNAADGRYQYGRNRSSTNISMDTTETRLTDTNPRRNKLPPLPCENTDCTSTSSGKQATERNFPPSNQDSSKGDVKPDRSPTNASDIPNVTVRCGPNAPAPPKRTESSKLRCKELLRTQKVAETRNCAEYCEIGASEAEDSVDMGDNVLYRKYLRRMIDPYYSSKFNAHNTPKSHQHIDANASSDSRTILFDPSEHYDRLSYNTIRRHNDATSHELNEQDSCFNLADQDFVFTRPTKEEKLRRSSTGRLCALKRQRATEKARNGRMGSTKLSPLTQQQTVNSHQEYTPPNQINIRTQSFSYSPRPYPSRYYRDPQPHDKTTPVIVVHEHETPFGTTTNQTPFHHEYQHLRFMKSGPPMQRNSLYRDKIPENDTENSKLTHQTGTTVDALFFEENPSKTNHFNTDGVDSVQASDKEEVEELKCLVQSILRSEKGDSKPVSRSDSTKDSIKDSYLATPSRQFLNLSSEIDLTESDDAGYLSPLTTVNKRADVEEEEEIFGEINIPFHRSKCNADHNNKLGASKSKKASHGHRKARKSSSNSHASNADDHNGYTSSESDDEYDRRHRRRITKPPRHQRSPVYRKPSSSELDGSAMYMSIIDTTDPIVKSSIAGKSEMAYVTATEEVFHCREREIYNRANLSQDTNENCYEEIISRQNSADQQPPTSANRSCFSASKSKRRSEENYYQEVTKVPPKKRRNKRHKSKFLVRSLH